MSAQAKARGQTFKVRGGNGTGMTDCEALVAAVLPTGWRWNYAVRLGKKPSGCPNCYKLDFALPMKKIGLEVDGSSHGSPTRKSQDRKKEAALQGLGWRVLRISNSRVRKYSISDLRAALTSLLEGS